jgi:ABC-type methionine transport system ATPase subunit
MIKLSNITKVFQQGNRTIQALNNVSLHVPAGKFMASSAHPAPVKVR